MRGHTLCEKNDCEGMRVRGVTPSVVEDDCEGMSGHDADNWTTGGLESPLHGHGF